MPINLDSIMFLKLRKRNRVMEQTTHTPGSIPNSSGHATRHSLIGAHCPFPCWRRGAAEKGEGGYMRAILGKCFQRYPRVALHVPGPLRGSGMLLIAYQGNMTSPSWN